jgi:hypothetical protein
MKKDELKKRVIARGEFSNHSHVITGENVEVVQRGSQTIIVVGEDSNAALKHLLETDWLAGKEVWTKEHQDISFADLKGKGKIGEVVARHGDVALERVSDCEYRYVQQMEFDPYKQLIQQVAD